MKKKVEPVTFETVRQLMNALPGVEEGPSYGTPAFRVRNKMLARLHDDGETLVLKCADRDLLIESDPKAFFVTKHYLNYPYVLVRLANVHRGKLTELLEQAWRIAASAKQIKEFENGSYMPPKLKPIATPAKPKTDGAQYLSLARRLCLALPEVEEQEAWGSPTFRVKGKMFAMYLHNHHGDGRIALWLKAPPGVQAMLVEAAPDKFFIPQYQGPFGWIGVHLDRNRDDEIASHIRQAYRMVAPKKLLAALEQES